CLARRDVRIAPEDRGRLALLGLLAVPLNQGLFLFGMQWASASHAALLYALTPTFVTLFALRGGGRPKLSQIVGLALAFAGVLSLMLQRGLHFDQHSLRGDALILLAVVAWAIYTVVGRGVTRRYGPLIVTSEAILIGALIFLPVGLLSLRGFDPARISAGGWGGLAYLALLTSALNYVIWFWGVAHLKPATVAMLTNIQPLVTVALAVAILHESVPAGFALSTALVLGGVWLTQGDRFRRAPALAG
ncbi:MAG: DMT family transporter, partial [Candidatus Eisenbacteria bacterium]|nr:DMT family transporter [Candidatus Eisenbacteria bacterium]